MCAESSSKVMAHTRISAKYPPLIDVTRTPLAYGDRALPRLVRAFTVLSSLHKDSYI